MGSWNGTCGITQLPILRGDKVVVFPIMKNEYAYDKGGGVVRSDNYFVPITVPFEGKYDDYGKVEDITDDNNLSFNHLSYILGGKIENMKNSNENIDELVKNIERGNFEDVGFMLVHDKVYRDIIIEMGNRRTIRKSPSNTIETLRERCNREAFELVENIRKDETFIYTMSLKDRSGFFNFIERGSYLYYIKDLIKKDNQKIFYGLINFMIFCESMEILRKLWIIQCGAGSQDEEFFVPKLIAEFMIEKEKELHEEYKEDNTDYEDVKDSIGKTVFL